MKKSIEFIKNIRFEYKMLAVFIILIILSAPYQIAKKRFSNNNGSLFNSNSQAIFNSSNGENVSRMTTTQTLSDMQTHNVDNNGKPKSISEALSVNRPLIINENMVNLSQQDLDRILIDIPSIKHIEIATQVENPTVWIYTLNDGLRKDEEALKYCKILHNRGIQAISVSIYDEKQRNKGKLVELGATRCI